MILRGAFLCPPLSLAWTGSKSTLVSYWSSKLWLQIYKQSFNLRKNDRNNKQEISGTDWTFYYKFILIAASFVRNHVNQTLSDRALMRWRLALIPKDTPSYPLSLSTLAPRAGNVSPRLSTSHYSHWFRWSALEQVRTLPWLIGTLQDYGRFSEFLMKFRLKAMPSLATEQPSLWTMRHSNTKWHIPGISKGWKITLQGKRRYS